MYVNITLSIVPPSPPSPSETLLGDSVYPYYFLSLLPGSNVPWGQCKESKELSLASDQPPGPEQVHVPLCRPLYLDQGLNPCCLHWKCRVLTTGSRGNFLHTLGKFCGCCGKIDILYIFSTLKTLQQALSITFFSCYKVTVLSLLVAVWPNG